MLAVTRRGFTLIELMAALVILGIVAAGIYRVLVTNQQTYLAQTQRIDLQQNIRAAATILPAEFREMNVAGANGDLRGMSATSLTIRAMRQLAFLCRTPLLGGGIGQVDLTVRVSPVFGTKRTFAVGDSLLVFYEGDKMTRSDDSWVRGEVKNVAAGTCADPPPAPAAAPAWVLRLEPTWIAGSQLNIQGAISNGSPVRGFSSVTYGLWLSPSDNVYYVGQTVGGVTQPLIGPLSGANGLRFRYFDAAGNETADSSRVAEIGIQLSGRTQSRIRQAGGAGVSYKVDNFVTRVSIRNNIRCAPICP